MNRVHHVLAFYRCSEQYCGVGAEVIGVVAEDQCAS
jgi:hypothetical protein